jgi:hypothetical protein
MSIYTLYLPLPVENIFLNFLNRTHSAYCGDDVVSWTVTHLLIKLNAANWYRCLIGDPQALLGKTCAPNSRQPRCTRKIKKRIRFFFFTNIFRLLFGTETVARKKLIQIKYVAEKEKKKLEIWYIYTRNKISILVFSKHETFVSYTAISVTAQNEYANVTSPPPYLS